MKKVAVLEQRHVMNLELAKVEICRQLGFEMHVPIQIVELHGAGKVWKYILKVRNFFVFMELQKDPLHSYVTIRTLKVVEKDKWHSLI